MKRFNKVKAIVLKHGVMFSFMFMLTGMVSTQSAWIFGQAEAPEELWQ